MGRMGSIWWEGQFASDPTFGLPDRIKFNNRVDESTYRTFIAMRNKLFAGRHRADPGRHGLAFRAIWRLRRRHNRLKISAVCMSAIEKVETGRAAER
jgi:hypothetical protein